MALLPYNAANTLRESVRIRICQILMSLIQNYKRFSSAHILRKWHTNELSSRGFPLNEQAQTDIKQHGGSCGCVELVNIPAN
jgi:hypothetical protein